MPSYTLSRKSLASTNHTLPRVAAERAVAYQIAMYLRIRDLRLAKGWNQSQLGEAAGVRTATVSKAETEPENVKLETLIKIAGGLGVPLVDLFDNKQMDPSVRKMVANFLRLTPEEREFFIRQVEALAGQDSSLAG